MRALATWVDPESSSVGLTRVYSYLGNPNLLAGYLIPAVALSLAALFTWQRLLPKALALTMVIVNSACLVLTFSRAGWIGFVVSVIVFRQLAGVLVLSPIASSMAWLGFTCAVRRFTGNTGFGCAVCQTSARFALVVCLSVVKIVVTTSG
ncbi:MAG: hypothetical protein U7123_06420 [Potamolinea sp.]